MNWVIYCLQTDMFNVQCVYTSLLIIMHIRVSQISLKYQTYVKFELNSKKNFSFTYIACLQNKNFLICKMSLNKVKI